MMAQDRLPCIQAAFGVIIAGPASVASSPPRPGKPQLHIARMRPDELSEEMTNFGNGEREEWSGLLGGIYKNLGCLASGVQSTDPDQKRMGEHDERDMAIPPDPTSDFVMVKPHIFGRFKIFLDMPPCSDGLDHLLQCGRCHPDSCVTVCSKRAGRDAREAWSVHLIGVG